MTFVRSAGKAPKPWRCPRCDRLLMQIDLRSGSVVVVVCERCGAINTREVEGDHETVWVDARRPCPGGED